MADKMPPVIPDWMPVPKPVVPLDSWLKKRRTPIKEVDWVVENMIAAGDITMLVGNGEVGKSWKAAHIAMCVASGEFADGLFPVKQGNVLWFDNENGPDENSRRAHVLDAGKGFKDAKFGTHDIWFHENRHWAADDDGLEAFRALVKAHTPVLVIFDSLVSIVPAGTDTNDAKTIRSVVDRITDVLRNDDEGNPRQKTIGCLVLHHTKKVGMAGSEDEWPTFLGSVDIRNAVSFMILMREKLFTDKDGVTHKLTQWRSDKHRRGKKDLSVYEFELIDHGEPKTGGFWVEYASKGKSQEFLDYVADKIRETIPDGSQFTRPDLVSGIKGFPEHREKGKRLIEELIKKGVIRLERESHGQNPTIYAKVSSEKALRHIASQNVENSEGM